MSKLAELNQEHEYYQRRIASTHSSQTNTLETLKTLDKKVVEDMLLILAKQAISEVRYEMPIGENNVYGTRRTPSHIRTGKWSIPMLALTREKLREWIKKPGEDKSSLEPSTGISRFNYSIDVNNPLKDGSKKNFSEDEIRVVNQALRASLFKAGNCGEMARLGIVKLCQAYTQHLSKGNLSAAESDQITFEVFSAPKSTMDHALIRISMNGIHVICDPWLQKAFLPTDNELEELGLMLFQDFRPDKSIDFDNRFQIFATALLTENPNHSFIRLSVSGPKEAKKIVDLYEKNEKAMRNMIAENQRDPTPFPNVAAYQDIKSEKQLFDSEKAKIEEPVIKVFPASKIKNAHTEKLSKQIEEHEFSKNIPESQLQRNIDLLEFIATHNEFKHKPSAINLIQNVIRNCSADKMNAPAAQLISIASKNESYKHILLNELSPYATTPSEITVDSFLLKKYEYYLEEKAYFVPEPAPEAWDGRSASGKVIASMLESYIFPRDIPPAAFIKCLAFLEFLAKHDELALNQYSHYLIENILRSFEDNEIETILDKLKTISKNQSYADIILQSFNKYVTKVDEITPDVLKALKYESYLNDFFAKNKALGIPKLPPKFSEQSNQLTNKLKAQIFDLLDEYDFLAKISPSELERSVELLEYFAINKEFDIKFTAINVIINSIKNFKYDQMDFILEKLISIAKNEPKYAACVLQILKPYATEISEINDVALMSRRYEYYLKDDIESYVTEIPPFEWYEQSTDTGDLHMLIQEHIENCEFPNYIDPDQLGHSIAFLEYLSNYPGLTPESAANVLLNAFNPNDIHEHGHKLIQIAQRNPIFEKMVLKLLNPLVTTKEAITVEMLLLKAYQNHLNTKIGKNLFDLEHDTPEKYIGKHYEKYSDKFKELTHSLERDAFSTQYYWLCSIGKIDFLTELLSPKKEKQFAHFVNAGALKRTAQGVSTLDHVISAMVSEKNHLENFNEWGEIAEKLVSMGANVSLYRHPNEIEKLKNTYEGSPLVHILYNVIYKAEPSLFHQLFDSFDLEMLQSKRLIPRATPADIEDITRLDNYCCKVSKNGTIYLQLSDNTIKLVDNDLGMIRHIFNAYLLPTGEDDELNEDALEMEDSLDIIAQLIGEAMIKNINTPNTLWVNSLTARELVAVYVHFDQKGISDSHPDLMKQLETRAFLLKGQNKPDARLLDTILERNRDSHSTNLEHNMPDNH